MKENVVRKTDMESGSYDITEVKSGSPISNSKNNVQCGTIKIHACIAYVYFHDKRNKEKH